MNHDEKITENTPPISIKSSNTPVKALFMLIVMAMVISIFVILNYAFGITDYWAGFLFLLYWGMFEHADIKKIPRCTVGALLGLLLGYLMQTLPHVMGSMGGWAALGVVLLVIYGQFMGWLPVAINAMTMIFLTVTTIPTLQTHTNFANVLIALLLGVAYFGGLIAIGKFFIARAEKRKQALVSD